MFLRVSVLVIAALLASISSLKAEEKRTSSVRAILESNCHRCHGQEGSVEGAMNYVMDLGKLVARKRIVPGDPASSRLLKRIVDGTMPPPGEMPRPSAADIATLRQWIEAGAPGATSSEPRSLITTANVHSAILADLEKLDRRSRRFQRYFTLTHLHNAGLGDDELQTYRNALAKLVNSLSWYPTIRNPEPIDTAKTILRIDLRWYQWDATIWNRIANDYPYGILDDNVGSRAIMVSTAAKLPILRADWFTANASRAPLYYDILQLPLNLNELERQIRADATANIQQERVMRVGFSGSGISRFNRILERHDSINGMYWRTYDFDEPPANLQERANGVLLADRRNIFAFPLGPVPLAEQPFQHAGGEAIFALPNGLHAYYLVKADNTRLDKGPIAIVSDPKRPDRAVEAGVSCMSCHITGILPKADQMRDHLEKNPRAFSRTDADLVRTLYPEKDTSLAKMADDSRKYTEAVAKTGAKVSRFEAVSTITLKYEADIDLPTAAAELGLAPEALKAKIDASPTLVAHVGALRAPGGTVTRSLWVQAFGDAVRELRLGTLFQANLNGPSLLDNTGELDPLESLEGTANAMLFSPDGRRAFIASSDRSVRLYDVEGRRDVKRFVGHTGSVWSVALSPDGTKLLSGSMDGTVRVWDIETAQERRRFNEHASLVSAVAFTPNGKWAVTGGFDGLVSVWKIGTGEEICRAEKMGFVTAIRVDPEGSFALVASDHGIVKIDLNSGAILHRYEGLSAAPCCLTLSPDGRTMFAGLDDGVIRVWNVEKTLPSRVLTGHEGSVRGVSLSADGKWLISASADRSVRLWNLGSQLEVAAFRKHNVPVVAAGFLANGTQTLSGDREVNLLPWRIERFFTQSTEQTPVPAPMTPNMIPLARP